MKKALSKSKALGRGADKISALPFIKTLVIVILLVILTMAVWPLDLLEVIDYQTGSLLKSFRLDKTDTFSIKYTHSVELTPVWETYTVREGDIYLTETVFKSFGAGLPSSSPYDFEVTEKGFRLYNIDKKMDELIYRTGAIKANHELVIGNKTIPFLSFSKAAQAVEIKVKSSNILEYIAREGLF